ncbi:hypothetical protein GIB67_023014 [Kingdonia uniflora]|uniref:Exopolyphosphatase n=1 Tax=Kingdonia uniflora TaxID=39325 RepID=A0A7J7P2J5_9MAGN|nr:hypothetical protein GIB67_023014 [Kingdonia uniflora]
MTSSNLLAAIDMGTNSFKMLLVQADPNGRFLALNHHKEPVVLGRGMQPNNSSTPTISLASQTRAIIALQNFQQILLKQQVHQTRIVATSAVREAVNSGEFISKIRDEVGFEVNVLSGEEEARLIYIGVLQFLPVYDTTVLTVDIGGGSTEFVIGKEGNVVFAVSLKLGHVLLTDSFVRNGDVDHVVSMREYIRGVIRGSGLVEKVREIGFKVAVGSSGTIRAIEKAVFFGYSRGAMGVGEFGRGWKFSRGELSGVVENLCGLDLGEEGKRAGFFKRRAEFILAGSILLMEIFEMLGIEEMEVSKCALGEGVIAETLAKCCEEYDVSANARWRSVVSLSVRFNNEKRMKRATGCVGIAKEFFRVVRKCIESGDHQIKHTLSLGEKDLEYLEAACLLHNIGQFIGEKGYHKQSSRIVKNGDYLHGYNAEEVKLIALLTRHHRKKFPSSDHSSLHGFPKEAKEKFRVLCSIIRIAVAVQKYHFIVFQGLDTSLHQAGFGLVFSEIKDSSVPVQLTMKEVEAELKPELDHFEKFASKLPSGRTQENVSSAYLEFLTNQMTSCKKNGMSWKIFPLKGPVKNVMASQRKEPERVDDIEVMKELV